MTKIKRKIILKRPDLIMHKLIGEHRWAFVNRDEMIMQVCLTCDLHFPADDFDSLTSLTYGGGSGGWGSGGGGGGGQVFISASGISPRQTKTPIVHGSGKAGETKLQIVAHQAVPVGEILMIHQAQGKGAGLWELNKVKGILYKQVGKMTLELSQPLVNNYS